jgi:hypothetical protein
MTHAVRKNEIDPICHCLNFVFSKRVVILIFFFLKSQVMFLLVINNAFEPTKLIDLI